MDGTVSLSFLSILLELLNMGFYLYIPLVGFIHCIYKPPLNANSGDDGFLFPSLLLSHF